MFHKAVLEALHAASLEGLAGSVVDSKTYQISADSRADGSYNGYGFSVFRYLDTFQGIISHQHFVGM